MNFKPTKLKTTISLLSGLVTNVYLVSNTRILCSCVTEPCICPQPTWPAYGLREGYIIATLIVLSTIYIAWSLIQKKR